MPTSLKTRVSSLFGCNKDVAFDYDIGLKCGQCCSIIVLTWAKILTILL